MVLPEYYLKYEKLLSRLKMESQWIDAEKRIAELRYRPDQARNANGTFKKENNSFKGVDNGGESGIIKAGSDKKMSISAIEQPIEQKHTGKGNPNAILIFDIELNSRQEKLLESLPKYDSRTIVPRDSVNMSDLSALTAKTGDEFAMFTRGNERLIARGNPKKVNISSQEAAKMAAEGYKWSGHTHPGITVYCLMPSDGDKEILRQFNQTQSVIYNSKGIFSTFDKE